MRSQCDEAHPECHRCRRRGRSCRYSRRDRSILVLNEQYARTEQSPGSTFENYNTAGTGTEYNLQLRTSRVADAGSGIFQTFRIGVGKQVRPERHLTSSVNPTPSRALSSPQSILVARFGATMGYDHPNKHAMQILGCWSDFIPSRIGSDATLDLAVRYLISSSEAFRLPQANISQLARATAVQATASLRALVANTARTHVVEDSLLLATVCHWISEQFMGLGSSQHLPHARGLYKMLQMRKISGSDDRLADALVDGSYHQEALDAMSDGRDSDFDNGDPPKTSDAIAKTSIPFDEASEYLRGQVIRLPRLCRLIKACLNSLEDAKVKGEAVALAEQLYLCSREPILGHLLGGVELYPTISKDVSPIYSISHRLPSMAALHKVLTLYTYQILLYALLQSLLSRGISSPHMEIARIEEQDVAAAIGVGMAVDYTLSADSSMPLAALRILTPLQIALGTWHRLEERRVGTAAARSAQQMQEWIVRINTDILHRWSVSRTQSKGCV